MTSEPEPQADRYEFRPVFGPLWPVLAREARMDMRLDVLYTYAWFVTFGLSFVLYLLMIRQKPEHPFHNPGSVRL